MTPTEPSMADDDNDKRGDNPVDNPGDPAPAPATAAPDPGESPTDASPTDAADTDEPSPGEGEVTEDSTSDRTPAVGATTPAWWSWVGRHRKRVGIVAALVVLAVAATVVTVSVVTPGPEDVVQSYMDALRAGDTQAALDIVGEPEDDERLRILSGDALADDWTVTSVVTRHRRDEDADVDVTIASGGTSEQGRFHLVKGDDGWRIESPFVEVDLMVGGLDTIELGGVRDKVPGDGARGTAVPLLLFPGVYDLYPSLREHVTFDPGVLVAAPQETTGRPTRLTVGYSLTDEGAAAAGKAIAARVAECESVPGLTPDGCPFNAENDPVVNGFSDVVGVTWAVKSVPEARFVPAADGTVRLVLHTPGTVTLTGKGIPYEPEDAAPVPFTATCEFGVDNLAVELTMAGVTVHGAVGRSYAAADTTNCF